MDPVPINGKARAAYGWKSGSVFGLRVMLTDRLLRTPDALTAIHEIRAAVREINLRAEPVEGPGHLELLVKVTEERGLRSDLRSVRQRNPDR